MAWYLYLLALVGSLFVLFHVSKVCEFYMKCSFFYICILVHAIECMVTMIPSYLRCAGCDVIFTTFRWYCNWTGVQVVVRGFEEHLAHMEESAVVVVNHQSFVDVVAMCDVWPPRGVVMMKSSLNYIPFFNVTSWLGHAIFVDRFNHSSAMISVDKCVTQLKEKRHKLWIFPEGTRHSGGMLPFKKGGFNIAVRAQIPIVPIVLSNYKPFYCEKERYFKTDGIIIAQVLPPISTEGKTTEDVPELADFVREEMLKVYDKISPEATEMMEKNRKAKAE